MRALVLDSGAVSYFVQGSGRAKALMAVLTSEDLWPPVVPSAVLVECLTGHPEKDARTNRFLKGCDIKASLSETGARRAAKLRTEAGRGSAVDAIIVAAAEPHGLVVTGDTADITALAANAVSVTIHYV
ncbi:MAG TPA: PIN domain-containing protein [Kribbella sp.]|uniref:PIN domain-containing protein n=1 Tax=Kribbella sp. TaxID=1871183 RepID=UPI002D79871E|nr:PIN domain-containing protein [Kribbella sp.]HET6296987.1 PIN domain-containing protein [Kribbella sp.]